MLAWLDCSEVDAFADGVVADLVKRVPPSSIGGAAKKAAERLKSTHDMVFARAEAFARAQRLNLYKKARLGNRVKWALKEAGYSEEFVDALTYELVTVVTLASSARTKS